MLDELRAKLSRAMGPAAEAVRDQVTAGAAYPVVFGSAMTGAGVPELIAGIVDFLPTAVPGTELRATVFKIERGRGGDRIAYARMHGGDGSRR
ncbi:MULTISPECIES: hypothetical protein [unclassified Amycolatopsis]|uniref:hypothetical protein n=1 Tax=unclassified Amycolatopsis TaxID=2618356 RepID=UPI00287B9EE4|nr:MULTISPECIES: hypothetical protein [unclassified Amycolatopsis]